MRGTLRIEASWAYKDKDNSYSAPPKHFGRPILCATFLLNLITIRESLEQAEKDGTVHVAHLTLAALSHLKQTEGLFRLPGLQPLIPLLTLLGSANTVTALQGLIDKGKFVDLSQEAVHDVGSLCKVTPCKASVTHW